MPPDPLAILERFLAVPRVSYVAAVVDRYGRAPGGLLANGLAFTALFASIPTALVALGLAGLLVDDPALQAALAGALSSALPPLAEVIDAALVALTEGAPMTSVIGLIGLIWTVSQLYVTLDVAFSRVFSGTAERDVVRRTARGFLWVAIVIALVIVAVVGAALLTTAETLLPGGSPIPAAIGSVATSWPTLLVLAVLLVAVVYRYVPVRSPEWSAVVVPALVTGLAIGVLTQLFAFLAPRLVGIASVVGPLATIFIALAWLSFSFQALLLGGCWVAEIDVRRRGPIESALTTPAAPTEAGGGRQ